jgi:Ras-related protein Rab-8A
MHQVSFVVVVVVVVVLFFFFCGTFVINLEPPFPESVNKILVGNKCDLSDQRVISEEAGRALAGEYGLKFMECSAKSAINVDDAFITLAKDIKARLIDSPEDAAPLNSGGSGASVVSGDDLTKKSASPGEAKKGGCC